MGIFINFIFGKELPIVTGRIIESFEQNDVFTKQIPEKERFYQYWIDYSHSGAVKFFII